MQTTQIEDTALVPTTLAVARTTLAAHPFALPTTPTNALALVDDVPTYYAQVADTSLGYDTPAGRAPWTVSKVALYGPDGQAWPSAFGTMREDTGAKLGVVGPRYTPLQNAQLAEALDITFAHLPARFRPRIVNAGTLGAGGGMGVGTARTGSKVFAQLALAPEISKLLQVPQDKDSALAAFLTLTNTHDGTSAAVIGASVTRIVCRNTWQMAHSESKRRGGLALKHTVRNVDAYREHVSKWLKEIAAGYAVQGERLRAYARKPMAAKVVEQVVSSILYPDLVEIAEATRAQAANIEAIVEMIEGRDGEFVAVGDVTAYSVLQATTAYEMHRRPARGQLVEQTDTRLWRVLTGDEVLPRAFRALDSLVMSA